MQETQVWSLVWKDLTCHTATKPVCHKYGACALEPGNHSCWAHVNNYWSPCALEPMLHKRNPHSGKPAHPSWKVVPASTTREKPAQQWRPGTAKQTNHVVDAILRFGEKVLTKGTQHFSTGRGAHPSHAYTLETVSTGGWTCPKSCQS